MLDAKKFLRVLIILLVSSLFIIRINSFPLKNWDEAWYAEITRNMAKGEHGYLMPFWNGQYYFDKSPLYFWLSFPFFKFFGPGEWQARIVAVLSAEFSIILIYLIGRKLFDKKTALLSTVVFVSFGQVIERLSKGNLDALLIFLILASFYFYLLAGKRIWYLFLSGMAAGLCLLTKGWLIGAFPFLVIFLYSLINEKKLRKDLLLVLLVALVTSEWWFIYGILAFGKPFFDWYLGNPAAGNLLSPLSSFSLELTKVALRDIGFWFLIPLIFFILKRPQNWDKHIIVFLLTVFVFFFSLSFLKEKFGWYLLPAYPFLAIVIGRMTASLFNKHLKLAFFLVLIILIFQISYAYKIGNIHPDNSSIGANLGKEVNNIIPKGDLVILDDNDFPAFLYYSDLEVIYVVSHSDLKSWEWWVIPASKTKAFIDEKQNIWVVSKNLDSLSPDLKNKNIIYNYLDFKIIKI
jgi:4-amino-4-deoxy-L-arabinose transferase-like glycosyltransferase